LVIEIQYFASDNSLYMPKLITIGGNVQQALGNLEYAAKGYERAIRLNLDDGSIRSSYKCSAQAVQREKLARELTAKESKYNQACFEVICGNVERALELLKIAPEIVSE